MRSLSEVGNGEHGHIIGVYLCGAVSFQEEFACEDSFNYSRKAERSGADLEAESQSKR